MRILLTGATGFLGAHIFQRLLQQEEVTLAILVRPTTNSWRIRPESGNTTVIEGDLQDVNSIRDPIRDFGPEVVIHSAWAGVSNRFKNDLLQIETNLSASSNLFQAAREGGCRTWIGLGSQAEYGPLNRRAVESDPQAPSTLYGAAKVAAYHMTRLLCEQASMRFAWLRVFSTYGPLEADDWLIPYLIGCLLRKEKPRLTRCEQMWDFVYGPDAADAIWSVARAENVEGVFNLGSGRVYPLREVVEMISGIIDKNAQLGFGEVAYHPDQVMHLEADVTRLCQATGWSPKTPLEVGLHETIAWHRTNEGKAP